MLKMLCYCKSAHAHTHSRRHPSAPIIRMRSCVQQCVRVEHSRQRPTHISDVRAEHALTRQRVLCLFRLLSLLWAHANTHAHTHTQPHTCMPNIFVNLSVAELGVFCFSVALFCDVRAWGRQISPRMVLYRIILAYFTMRLVLHFIIKYIISVRTVNVINNLFAILLGKVTNSRQYYHLEF